MADFIESSQLQSFEQYRLNLKVDFFLSFDVQLDLDFRYL